MLKEKETPGQPAAGLATASARSVRGKRRTSATEPDGFDAGLQEGTGPAGELQKPPHPALELAGYPGAATIDPTAIGAASAAIAQASAATPLDAPWPPEVDLILSAMDAGRDPNAHDERRDVQRRPYRVRAILRLFSDTPGTGPWTIYTRDVDPRGLGFLSPHRLPLGYGGWIELPSPGGRLLKIHCTLFRCREAVKGWFDGALYFNREQHVFGC